MLLDITPKETHRQQNTNHSVRQANLYHQGKQWQCKLQFCAPAPDRVTDNQSRIWEHKRSDVKTHIVTFAKYTTEPRGRDQESCLRSQIPLSFNQCLHWILFPNFTLLVFPSLIFLKMQVHNYPVTKPLRTSQLRCSRSHWFYFLPLTQLTCP